MTISAVIPVWNGKDLLAKLLASLRAQTAAPEEILAIDNGSTDGAPALAIQFGARVISMGRNTGFAPAVNRGIQESRCEWIAVLNTDVELAPNYFARLIEAATAARGWFATGKILSAGSHDRIDGTFDAVCRGGAACRIGSGSANHPVFENARKIWSAPWTAALFRKSLFERTGLLDESFEAYLEDVEFGLRCALNECGGIYVPDAIAWHVGSAALGRWNPHTVRLMTRNQLWLMARHHAAAWRGCLWHAAVAQTLWAGLAIRHSSGLAWLDGVIQGLQGFGSARARRCPWPPAKLTALLAENDSLIYESQSASGFDNYWKLYFMLAGRGKVTHG